MSVISCVRAYVYMPVSTWLSLSICTFTIFDFFFFFSLASPYSSLSLSLFCYVAATANGKEGAACSRDDRSVLFIHLFFLYQRPEGFGASILLRFFLTSCSSFRF